MSRTRGGYLLLTAMLFIGLSALSLVLYRYLMGASIDIPAGFVRSSAGVLLVFLVLLIIRYMGLLWFSYLGHLESPPASRGRLPLISILVPAYNESTVIDASLRSLMKLDYPRYEVIVIDDGSSDHTFQRAKRYEGDHGRALVRVIRQRNGGKSRALNNGIAHASGDYVLCMDSDSVLGPGALRAGIRHLVGDPRVAAVAGSVKVVNRSNMLSNLQALEYVEGLNMVRAAQGFFRFVNIVPGPIGIFRKRALAEIGGYDHDTFAEDCDLTLKLLANGWQVKYEPGATAFTEAPEKLIDLLKQRYRWTRGIVQAISKHKLLLVDPRRGIGITFTLWYMVFEGIAWPLMNVFGNVLFVFVAVQHGTAVPLVLWCAQLMVLDLAAALYCVLVEEESIALVPYAVLYRAFFALTIDLAKLFATFEEFLNLKMDWGKLDRIGRI